MNTEVKPLPRQHGRVVLATQGMALSEFAVVMSRMLLRNVKGELTGLFVEDANLLMAASLPLTREVGRSSGIVRPLEAQDIERLLQRRAQSFQSQLVRLAGEVALPWTFERRRGDFVTHILEELREAHLVVVGARDESGKATAGGDSIFVVMEASNSGLAVLHAALNLAKTIAKGLNIYVVSRDAQSFEKTRRLILEFAEPGTLLSLEPSFGIPEKIQSPPLGGGNILVLSANLLPRHASTLLARWAGRLVLVSDAH